MPTPSQTPNPTPTHPSEMPWQADRDMLAAMVAKALPLWGWGKDEVRVKLIHISENASFHITPAKPAAAGMSWVLRLHRPHYQNRTSIQSELEWLGALATDFGEEAFFPAVVLGVDGEAIQTLAPHASPNSSSYFAVVFTFIPGDTPQASQPRGALITLFGKLGEMAARLHLHAETWQPAATFTRLAWDVDGIYGAHKHWGDWRAAPHVTDEVRAILEETEAEVTAKLKSYGKAKERFGLIHADMRFANVLVGDRIHLIDFDDCGFGWFMYDFAASLSFIEDTPALPQLKAAWLAGYKKWREVGADDTAMLDSFIMLRRMLLLAWLGSHPQADIAPSLTPDFASTTARLAQRYLAGGL